MYRLRGTGQAAGWKAVGLAMVIVAELLLLLGAFVPLMEAGPALDANQPARLSYLWWSGTASKPGVFVMVSLIVVRSAPLWTASPR